MQAVQTFETVFEALLLNTGEKKWQGKTAFAHKEVLIQLQSTDTHGNTTFLNFKAAIRSASIPAFGKEEKKKKCVLQLYNPL